MVATKTELTWKRWKQLPMEDRTKLIAVIDKSEVPVSAREPLVLMWPSKLALMGLVPVELMEHLNTVHDNWFIVPEFKEGMSARIWYWEVGSSL